MLKLKDRNMTKTGIDYLGWRPYGGASAAKID